MNGDAISRQAVLKQLKGCLTGGETEYNYVKIHIDNIPPVTPQPKTGHWINIINKNYHDFRTGNRLCNECSECKSQFVYRTNYCPHCGAKMAESEDK